MQDRPSTSWSFLFFVFLFFVFFCCFVFRSVLFGTHDLCMPPFLSRTWGRHFGTSVCTGIVYCVRASPCKRVAKTSVAVSKTLRRFGGGSERQGADQGTDTFDPACALLCADVTRCGLFTYFGNFEREEKKMSEIRYNAQDSVYQCIPFWA